MYPLPQDGPPILVVHGLFTTAQSMLLVASLLAAAFPHRTVLVPDLLGFDFAHSIPRRASKAESAGRLGEDEEKELSAGRGADGADAKTRQLPGWTEQASSIEHLIETLIGKRPAGALHASAGNSRIDPASLLGASIVNQLSEEGHD